MQAWLLLSLLRCFRVLNRCNLVFRRFFEPAAIIGRCFLSQIAHARDSSRKLDSPLAYSRFSASYNKSLLIYCSTFKQKHYEKQGTLENGDSVRHIDSDGSTDCYEHHFVHGTWPDIYLKASPRICGDSLFFKISIPLFVVSIILTIFV